MIAVAIARGSPSRITTSRTIGPGLPELGISRQLSSWDLRPDLCPRGRLLVFVSSRSREGSPLLFGLHAALNLLVTQASYLRTARLDLAIRSSALEG